MPVILDNGSEELRTWLDPKRYEWSKDLQSLLKPFDGELEVYPVSKDVGKVGNNSPTFLIPIDSKENKSNIANFFGKGASSAKTKTAALSPPQKQPHVKIKEEAGFVEEDSKDDNIAKEGGQAKSEYEKQDVAGEEAKLVTGIKREAADDASRDEPPKKAKPAPKSEPSALPQKKGGVGTRSKISATSNGTKSPEKSKQTGSRKITQFFGNSS